jgi:hypothetical protein
VNSKRVYRLYPAEGLGVSRRKRKRSGPAERLPLALLTHPNPRWSRQYQPMVKGSETMHSEIGGEAQHDEQRMSCGFPNSVPGAIVPFSKLHSIRLPLFMTGDILK